MGRGIFIMLPKQLRKLGSIYIFHPGYHGNADITIKFCRPFTLHSPYQEIVSVSSKFPPWPIDYKLFNPGYHGNSQYMEKVEWKAQVILSCYQKILSQRNRYSLPYQASIFILCTFYCFVIK